MLCCLNGHDKIYTLKEKCPKCGSETKSAHYKYLSQEKLSFNLKELAKFGIINIDKPSGPTSFETSSLVRKWFNTNKTSHFGTLDPMVSGVLPVALGRACRLNDYFMHKNKTYVGIMRLHSEVSEKSLREIIKKFIGKINQLPPVRSRVKRALRERTVHSFEIIEIDSKDVLFETEVQAGTYIRKLCDDMGKEIGGAHMLELRRTKAGVFNENSSSTLYELEKSLKDYQLGKEKKLKEIIIPAEEAIKKVLPVLEVKEKSVNQLLTGKPIMKSDLEGALPEEEKFALFSKGKLISIAKKSEEGDIIARSEFVVN